MEMMKPTGWVIMLVLTAAVGLAGCSRTARAPQGSGTAGAESPWRKTVLWVEQSGQTQPFDNGARLALGDITLEIFVAPFPPLREGSIDLYLTETATGRPAEASALKIVFDMYMPHGSLRAEAVPTGGGHFLVPYRLVMPGEWRVDISIVHRNDVSALALIFKVE